MYQLLLATHLNVPARVLTHYLLIITHYILLITHYILLITRYSLLITHYSLLITHYSLLITHHSLLNHRPWIVLTHYSLLITHYPTTGHGSCTSPGPDPHRECVPVTDGRHSGGEDHGPAAVQDGHGQHGELSLRLNRN